MSDRPEPPLAALAQVGLYPPPRPAAGAPASGTASGPGAASESGAASAQAGAPSSSARRSIPRAVVSVLLFAAAYLLLSPLLSILVMGISGSSDPIVYEAVTAVLFVCLVAALGGRAILVPRLREVGVTLAMSWWLIVATVLISLPSVIYYLSEGTPLADGWLSNVLYMGAFTLLIGVAEEAMCRGVLFNGLLAAMGRTRVGLFAAAVLTSVTFGAMHIDWLAVDLSDPMQLAQSLLKMAETAMFSFFLCALVAHSCGLAGVAVVHALTDFIPFAVLGAFEGLDLDIPYVSTDEEAGGNVSAYIMLMALYLPLVVYGCRILLRQKPPVFGGFAPGSWGRPATRHRTPETPEVPASWAMAEAPIPARAGETTGAPPERPDLP